MYSPDKKEDSNNKKKNKWQTKNSHLKSIAKKLMKIVNNYLAINFLKVSEDRNKSEGSRKTAGGNEMETGEA